MAKVRLIAITLLVAMASLTVGFAWTGPINLGATVQTGSFQVTVVEAAAQHDGVVSVQKCVADDEVKFTIGNLHPGAEVTLHVKIANAGGHNVRFRSAKLTWDGDEALKPFLQVQCGYQYDRDSNGKVDGSGSVAATWQELGAIARAMNNDRQLKNMVLEPGGTFYLGNPLDGVTGATDREFRIKLSKSAPNAVQNASATFELRLNWEQAVDDRDEDREESEDYHKDKRKETNKKSSHDDRKQPHDNEVVSRWSGLVEIRWRRVLDLRSQGWRVYGDLYLISHDGSRHPFVKAALNDSFPRYGKLGGPPQSFVVTTGEVSRCYSVAVPREPAKAPTIVLGPTLMVPTDSLPPAIPTLAVGSLLSERPQYVPQMRRQLTKEDAAAAEPKLYLLSGPLYPGVTQLRDLRLVPIGATETRSRV